MTGWAMLAAGTLLGTIGMTVMVAAAGANRIELYRWITTRAPGARAARVLLAAPDRTVGSAVGIAAAGVLIAGFGLRAVLGGLPHVLLIVAVVLVVMPLLLTVVYAFPQVAGRRWAEQIVRGLVPWVGWLATVFAPLLPRGSAVRPRADLARPRSNSGEEKALHADELNLVSGVLAFTERPVREVMTPRTEIVAVREGAPVGTVSSVFAESGYSRMPVYRDSLDNIVGMIYVFDLLKLAPGAELLVRPVTVAPGSRPCADLLFEMQRERHQLAVILDEYGGTAGIATLDDLLAQLVGETFETARSREEPGVLTGEVIEVVGTTPPADVAARFDIRLPGDAETIGGLLTHAAGRIPRSGDRYEMAGLEFDILSATATRVERIAVRRGVVPVIHLGPDGAG